MAEPPGLFLLVPRFVVSVGRVTPEGLKLVGSAFLVGPGKFATARHVSGDDDPNLVIIPARIPTLNSYEDTSNTQVLHAPARISAVDTFRDITVLEVAGAGPVPYTIGGTDDVVPGDPIVTFGFPHADTGRFVLTRQDTHVGARILIDASGVKSKHIVLNTQARPGQSGGPVFARDASRVVAMLIGSYAPNGGGGISLGGVDPATLHQTTHAISAEYIPPML
jgi:hypothetical protein